MKQEGGDALSLLLKLPADIILVALAGVVSLFSCIHCTRITHADTYLFFIQDASGFDIIRACLVLIGLVAGAQLLIAFLRFKGFCRLNFNKYVMSLVSLLLCNFLIGLILTDARAKTPDTVDTMMREKLEESILAQRSLGVGYGQSERWDTLQTQMLCCGIDSYQDYIRDKTPAKEQVIPMSCCVMKHTRTTDGGLIVENPSQCMLDATHKVRHSVFLHIQGCKSLLSRWVVTYISRVTALLFTAICIQAATLLYLSWQGYQRQTSVSTWR